MFQDNPEIFNKINTTTLDIKPLVKITKEYHNHVCSDYDCIDYTKSTTSHWFIEPTISYNFESMKLINAEGIYDNSSIAVGINLRYIPFKSFHLFNLLTGLHVSKSDFAGDGIYKNYWTIEIDFTQKVHYCFFRIPLALEYHLPTEKVQPFLMLAYHNIILTDISYSAEPESKLPDLGDFRTYQFGFSGGIGLRIKTTESAYLQIKMEYEFRKPLVNMRSFYDRHEVTSWIPSIGYGFKLN